MADINDIYKLLGKEKFEPNKIDTDERIEAIEEAIIELADILLGGESNG